MLRRRNATGFAVCHLTYFTHFRKILTLQRIGALSTPIGQAVPIKRRIGIVTMFWLLIRPALETCESCGDEISRGDCRTCDSGEAYCDICYDAEFTSCESCGDEISRGDCRTCDSGDAYCYDCYSQRFDNCYSCRCEVDIEGDDFLRDEDGDIFCCSCYWDRYTRCDSCSCELAHDNAFCCDNGTFCSGCRDEGEFWESRPLRLNENWTFAGVGSRRAFGVELETSQADDRAHIQDDTIFGCVDDCSITGAEFVSPILRGDDGLLEIGAFCMAAKGFKVDGKCGFHLHVDCSDLSPAQLWAVAVGYSFTEPVWRLFVPQSRAANRFCAPWPQSTHDMFRSCDFAGTTHRDVVSAVGWERYHVCNLTAYDRHKTIEIRLHSATLNAQKIANWVKAHTRFIDFCTARTARGLRSVFRDKTNNQVFRVLADRVWREDSLAQFYLSRAAKFGHSLKYVPRCVDGRRARRIADPARQTWYAAHRSERFAARMATV